MRLLAATLITLACLSTAHAHYWVGNTLVMNNGWHWRIDPNYHPRRHYSHWYIIILRGD